MTCQNRLTGDRNKKKKKGENKGEKEEPANEKRTRKSFLPEKFQQFVPSIQQAANILF